MTPIAQMECCTMLGVDPKTLRNWLRHACMQFIAHPTDARLKCLTWQQVQQLARLHARPLQMPPPASPALPEETAPINASEEHTPLAQKNDAQLVAAVPLSEEAELRKTVCRLEANVMTLQEHLTQLTLELLRVRSEQYERRLSTLEALLPQNAGTALPLQHLVPIVDRHPSPQERQLQPAELRARSRVIARVEYGTQGFYVLVCPQEGMLSFSTDSREWFDWLASLTSLRFIGPQGRFTAYREAHTRSWKAHRSFHGRCHKRSLGTTDRLTIAHLEHIAAALQSDITSLL